MAAGVHMGGTSQRKWVEISSELQCAFLCKTWNYSAVSVRSEWISRVKSAWGNMESIGIVMSYPDKLCISLTIVFMNIKWTLCTFVVCYVNSM